jgi:hypothetical protein
MIYSIVPQQGPLFLSREAEFGKIEPILIPLFKMQYGSIGWFNTLMMQSFQVTSCLIKYLLRFLQFEG